MAEQNPMGKLSERVRSRIGAVGSKAREEMPASAFLLGQERKYPVKLKVGGEWKYDRALLLAAARRARLLGEEAIAQRADSIRAREFGKSEPVTKEGYTPTAAMRSAAARGLELRRKFNRGGTIIGVARARDLVNGRSLSADTVKRMYSYFARHAVDKQASGWNDASAPSAGWIAWLLWGGDSGAAWSKRHADAMRAGKVKKEVVSTDAGGEKVPMQNDKMSSFEERVRNASRRGMQAGTKKAAVSRGSKPRIVVTESLMQPVLVTVKTADGKEIGVALPVEKDDPPSMPLPIVEREDAERYVAGLVVSAQKSMGGIPLTNLAYVAGVEKDGKQGLYGLVARVDGEEPRLVEAYFPPISVGYKASFFTSVEKKTEVIETTKRVVAKSSEQEWFPQIIQDGDKRVATYVVLEPEEVDKQGDIYASDVIETAAHDFLANYNTNKTRPEEYDGTQTGVRHAVFGVDVDVVESYIAPVDMTFGEEVVRKGSWVASLRYRDDALWEKVKGGELPGISIGGAARAIMLRQPKSES